jgi:hypothetical protein
MSQHISQFHEFSLSLIYSAITVAASPLLILFGISNWAVVKDILQKSRRASIKEAFCFNDAVLLSRVWSSPIGLCYSGAVEYQSQEGYCSSATQRSILKSIPNFKPQHVPQPKWESATLLKLTTELEQGGCGMLRTNIVYGSEGYDAFLDVLKKVNDVRYRVSINFLRSPLFGFKRPYWLPINLLSCFFGGHHSILLGYIEEQNLVAVFDVNHNYGAFLVDARRLYDAVATFPIVGSKGKSRGLVVAELVQ